MPLQFLEAMTSRKRRPNWTDQECLLLAQLMQERREVIRGKCSMGISIQDKRQAWEEITQAINTAFPHIQRTVSDCNKKWENLLAKSREEIKRQRRQAGSDEALSFEEFSTVTQIVISVMNLSDMLQHEDSSGTDFMEMPHNSSDHNGNDHRSDEDFPNKRPPSDHKFLTYPHQPPSPVEQKYSAFSHIPRSLPPQFGSSHAAIFTGSGEHSYTPASASPTSVQCTAVQERVDLEMSVLRRQEAVLKLQEEYYTLKIKLMKKKMEEPFEKD